MKTFSKIHQSRGYTLLFAVLVTSLVLSIGISILNISKKEFLLTTSMRDSTLALYSADGGVECAAFADQWYDAFLASGTKTGLLKCGVAMGSVSAPVLDATSGTTTFTFAVKFGDEGESCASVKVKKGPNQDGTTATVIEARGYNIGWSGTDCSVPSPKKVERGLRLTY